MARYRWSEHVIIAMTEGRDISNIETKAQPGDILEQENGLPPMRVDKDYRLRLNDEFEEFVKEAAER